MYVQSGWAGSATRSKSACSPALPPENMVAEAAITSGMRISGTRIGAPSAARALRASRRATALPASPADPAKNERRLRTVIGPSSVGPRLGSAVRE